MNGESQYTQEDCINALIEARNELGETPSTRWWGSEQMVPSYGTIYKLFGSWENAIEEAGLDSNDHKNRKPVDSGYFDKIDSPKKSYFLGLLFGDGCMYDAGNRLQIILALTDFGLVEEFKSSVSSGHKIQYRSRNENESDVARIAIGDNEFCENLVDLGIDSNKTLSGSPPDIDKRLRGHFVRGLYDADGCQYKYRWMITTASENCVDTLQSWLPVESRIEIDDRSNNDVFDVIVGKKSWDTLRDWLYPCGEITTPKLNRKTF